MRVMTGALMTTPPSMNARPRNNVPYLGDVPNFARDCCVFGAAPAISVINFFKIASAKVS
jgi:hypothetical protein